MMEKSWLLGQTETEVHSEETLRAQRFCALAKDQYALGGVSVYGQLIIGLSMYLYQHVSTPGYLSIALTLPFLLFLFFASWYAAKNTPAGENVFSYAAGKCMGAWIARGFALIFWLDGLLAAYALTAVMQSVLPNMSTLLISLSVTVVIAFTVSGREPYALHRLARFLRWIFLAVFLYCAITALPYGSLGHFFPLLGEGGESIFQGGLWMCGCLGGVCCPLLMPQSEKSQNALLKRKSSALRPFLLALLAGIIWALLSAFLMPFYALSRGETLGWRMLLIAHISPSLAVWSLFLCGQMFLLMIALSAGITRSVTLIMSASGKKKKKDQPFLIALLLLLQTPLCALNLVEIENALSCFAPIRGALAGVLAGVLALGAAAKKRKEGRAGT